MSFSHSSTPPKTQRDRKPRILREGRCREICLAVPGVRTGVGQSRVCPWVPRSGYPIPSVRLAHGCLGWKAHPATAAPCSKVYPSLKDSARLKTKWTSASPVSLTRCNERAGLVTSIQFTHLLTEVENEGPSLSCAACSRWPCFGRGLDWMTLRGPFHPPPCWDSVIFQTSWREGKEMNFRGRCRLLLRQWNSVWV